MLRAFASCALSTFILLTSLSFLPFAASADIVTIGNATPKSDWNRASAAVRVFDSSQAPPFRTLAIDESAGPTASVSGVSSAADGLVTASSSVDAYHFTGGVTTASAAEGVYVSAQLRDQIYVEADFDEDSILEFEFTLDYSANISDPGFSEFQFTLFALGTDDSFLFLDDASSVDFGLGSGPYDVTTSRTFNVSTAMSGADDVLISSGTYVPLQFTLTGIVDGTGTLNYLDSFELTGFNVLDGNGDPLGAVTSSAQDPANQFLNTNPIPEPITATILMPFALTVLFRRRRIR